MNIKIPAPFGLKTSFITLRDVVRVENCTLTFFGKSAHNLYIFEKVGRGEELFTLYSYPLKKDMEFAFKAIQELLKDKAKKTITLEMEPMRKV